MDPINITLNINVVLPEAITTLLQNLVSIDSPRVVVNNVDVVPAEEASVKAESAPAVESTPEPAADDEASTVTKEHVRVALSKWLDTDDESHNHAGAKVILQKIADDEAVTSLTKLESDLYPAALEAFAV